MSLETVEVPLRCRTAYSVCLRIDNAAQPDGRRTRLREFVVPSRRLDLALRLATDKASRTALPGDRLVGVSVRTGGRVLT